MVKANGGNHSAWISNPENTAILSSFWMIILFFVPFRNK